jgi:PBP1b-binding outer membrane lipoprotein LpoB
MKDIQYIILRSKQIKNNTIIYEVRDIKTGEVEWVYQEYINEKYVSIEEYRDLKINRILS